MGLVVAGLVVALVAMLCTTVLLKGKVGMFLLGFLIRLCWLFAAARLAKPRSLWARAYYRDARLVAANQRYPSEAAPWPVVLPPPPPPDAVLGARLLTAAAIVMIFTGPPGGLLGGVLLMLGPLVARGWRVGRTVVTVLVGVFAVVVVGFVVGLVLNEASDGRLALFLALGVIALGFAGAAIHRLFGDATTAYFRAGIL